MITEFEGDSDITPAHRACIAKCDEQYAEDGDEIAFDACIDRCDEAHG